MVYSLTVVAPDPLGTCVYSSRPLGTYSLCVWKYWFAELHQCPEDLKVNWVSVVKSPKTFPLIFKNWSHANQFQSQRSLVHLGPKSLLRVKFSSDIVISLYWLTAFVLFSNKVSESHAGEKTSWVGKQLAGYHGSQSEQEPYVGLCFILWPAIYLQWAQHPFLNGVDQRSANDDP